MDSTERGSGTPMGGQGASERSAGTTAGAGGAGTAARQQTQTPRPPTQSSATGGSTNQPSRSPGPARAADVADTAREAASGVADQVRDEVSHRLTEQVERAAANLGIFSEAIVAVGQQLREHDQQGLAEYADQAAERVEEFSGYLRGKQWDEVLEDVEWFARRQPAIFLGGAFAVGLLASRFLKSSSRRELDRRRASRPFAAGDYYGYRARQYGYWARSHMYPEANYGSGPGYGAAAYNPPDATSYNPGPSSPAQNPSGPNRPPTT